MTKHGNLAYIMQALQLWRIKDFIKGAKFLLATSAYTKGGQTMFTNFFSMEKNFLPKGMAQCPSP